MKHSRVRLQTRSTARIRQSGFTLIEVVVAAGLMLVLVVGGAGYTVRHVENMSAETAADHLRTVAQGASTYAEANREQILATLESSPTASVTIPALKAQGYLSQSLRETNNYGQAYSVRFVSSGPNSFEGVVVTQGGESIKPTSKRRIAQSMGLSGGHLDEASMSNLTGTYGGWSRPLADFGMAPGEADLAYALFVEDSVKLGGISDQYMARNRVSGMPELNQMQTDLDLDGNSLHNVGAIVAEEAKITSMTAGRATLDELIVNGQAQFNSSTPGGVVVNRENASYNAHIEYRTMAGRIFAGQGRANMFAVGDRTDLQVNNWIEISSSGTRVLGEEVWTAGTFNPDSKADRDHLHDGSHITTGTVAAARIANLDASKITTGTLNAARIPNLDASKIASGTLATARIPNLDASKINSGVLATARIPTLPIGQIAGLQGALDTKLNLSGGRMTGPLTIDTGARPLTFVGTGVGHSFMQWYIDSESTRSAYVGFGSTANTTFTVMNERGDLNLRSSGNVLANNHEVLHRGNFNPDSKSDVGHTHAAQDVTSGTLADARIPSLNASKITAGTFAVARIPNLDAGKITTGTFAAARIPNLDASKISSGVLAAARLPSLPISQITGLQSALDSKLNTAGGVMTGQLQLQTTGTTAAVVSRTNASINANVEYRTTSGSVFAGQGKANTFTVGRSSDLSSAANAWMEVTATGAKVLGSEVWTAATFNPSSKANTSHTHAAADITSGTLADARIPNLNASKITAGVLNAARIPNLDAAKITAGTLAVARVPNLDASKINSGVLNVARIPQLPISKVEGLQSALDGKLSRTGDEMTGQLRLRSGARPLVFDGRAGGHAYMEWYVQGDARSAYLGFGSGSNATFTISNDRGGDIDLSPSNGSNVRVSGNIVYHAGNFNPASKADVNHSHNAADVTTGVLNAARIPNLNASKITAGTFSADRIPNLDAAKITAGTLHANRIPTLPISKISNLQSGLDSKLNTSGGSVTGALNVAQRTTTNDLLISSVAVCNATCSPNGLLARTSTGAALSCVSSRWQGFSCSSGGGGGGGGVCSCPIGFEPSGTGCQRTRQPYEVIMCP